MNAILVIFCVFASVIQQIGRKEYDKRYSGGSYSFSAGGVLVTLIYFAAMGDWHISIFPEMLGYVFPFAIFYALAYFCTMRAIESGSLSLTSLMISYSLIIPTLYGIAVLKEPVTIFLVIGIALLLISMVLIEYTGNDKTKKVTLRWIIYVGITFFANGICTTLQKLITLKYQGSYTNDFMVISLAIAAFLLLSAAIVRDRREFFGHIRHGAPWYGLCGVGNGLANQLTMILAVTLPASFLYPLLSCGGIILTALASVAIYKEKLTFAQKIGFFLGVAAICILNIKL